MTEQTKQTVILDAQVVLNTVRTVLPILEAAGISAGPAGLGVSAAAALLLPLIAMIPTGELITVAQQAELAHRVANLMDFTGPQWVVSTAPKPVTPPTA